MANAEFKAAAEQPPLQGAALLLGALALALATFMIVLDSSIANVSLSAIAGDLGVSPSQGTWVITSFSVANAISVPLTGWLTQRLGAVRLFITSVLLFVLASWACGLAHSLEALVAYRVVQGLVAGPMIPLSQTLLLSSFHRSKAGMALALWAMTTLVAPVVGPLLGGWITDNITWPWIFYINVPVGLLVCLPTWVIYRKRETPRMKLPIDRIGLALLVLGVGSLQLMLDKGQEQSWFESNLIQVLAVVAALGLAVFILWELGEAHPVVDLRLFLKRNFAVGVGVNALGYGVFIGNLVLMPLWLQQYMGYNATTAGLVMAPVGLLAIVVSPVLGKWMARIDPRIFTSVSFALFALVFYIRSEFTTGADMAHLIWPTLLQGAALPLFFMPLTAITLSGMTATQLPAAAGLSSAVRITAGAVGTSLVTTLWEQRTALHRAHLTELLAQGDRGLQSGLEALQSGGMPVEGAMAQLSRMIDQQAATRGMDDVYALSSWLLLAMVGLVWLAHGPGRAGKTAGAGGGADAAAAAAH